MLIEVSKICCCGHFFIARNSVKLKAPQDDQVVIWQVNVYKACV